MPINISNAKNRDAVVAMEGLSPVRDVYYRDEKGNPVATRKLLKSDVDHDLDQLMKKRKKMESVAKALMKEDPEVVVFDIKPKEFLFDEPSNYPFDTKPVVTSLTQVANPGPESVC